MARSSQDSRWFDRWETLFLPTVLFVVVSVLFVGPSAARQPTVSLEWGPPILTTNAPSWRTPVASGASGFVSLQPGFLEEGYELETTIRFSADGLAWESGLVTLEGVRLEDAVGSDDGFVAVGHKEDGPAVWTSQDGRVWQEAASVDSPNAPTAQPATADGPARKGSWMKAVTRTTDGFVAVGGLAGGTGILPAVWTSVDGEQWADASVSLPSVDGELEDVAFGDRGLVAVARTESPGDSPGEFTVWWSEDGTVWLDAADGLPSDLGLFIAGIESLGTEGFVLITYDFSALGATAWTSTDGLSWTAQSLPVDPDTESTRVGDMATDETLLVAVGDEVVFHGLDPATSNAAIWVSENGTDWIRVPPESLRSDETLADVQADTVYRAGSRWVVYGSTDEHSEDQQPVVWLGRDPSLPPFDDVAADDLFADDVAWLAEQEVTKGCNPPFNTLFCPNLDVTRGQMAAFLVRALGYTDGGGDDLFTDDDTSIFEDDIDKLATAQVTKGCNPPFNTLFCPNLDVTRGQMAAFLHRALAD